MKYEMKYIIVQTFEWKAMKENQECTIGDYSSAFSLSLFYRHPFILSRQTQYYYDT